MPENFQQCSEEVRRQHAEFGSFVRLVAFNRRNKQRFSLPSSVDTKVNQASWCSDINSDVQSDLNDVNASFCTSAAIKAYKDEKIVTPSKGQSSYALLPDHKLRRYWESFIFVLIVYVAFVSVFVYSFLGVLGVGSPWFWAERFLDAAFAVDIVFNFFTAFEKDGFWVKDLRLIRRHYMRNRFILDVIATVPWDVIALVSESDESVSNLLELPRFIRLMRLFKLFRLVKFFHLQQQFTWLEIRFRLKYGYIRLIGLFSAVIFIAHLFSCLFYYFGVVGNPAVEETWTTNGIPEDLYGKYITALYFSVYTITTIGYGDVVPISTLERTYTILIMLLGAACFTYVISQVSSICYELNASSVQNRILMDSIIDLQKSRNLDYELVFDIRRFFKREHLRQRVVSESELLHGMSKDLRVRVLKHLYGPHLKKSRLFNGIPHGHEEDIYVHAKELFARKNQTLFKRGDRADCFYVIIRGSVMVTGLNNERTTLIGGYSFGETDILFQRLRKEDAICTAYTDLIKVPRSAVMEVLERFPDVLEKLRHEESLILWEAAIWHVEQQIRYKRMALKLRELSKQYMRRRGNGTYSSSKSSPERRKISFTANQPPEDTIQPVLQPSEAMGESKVDAMQHLKHEAEKKSREIEELRKWLKELQEPLEHIVSRLQNL